MILKEAFRETRNLLSQLGIENSTKEAEILLCHVLSITPLQLYTWPEKRISSKRYLYLKELIERRLKNEPIPYITETCSFYDCEFYIDNSVLIPRPETELLLEHAITIFHTVISKKNNVVIADIGTGSGIIATCLAKHLATATMYATDISENALHVAIRNFQKNNVLDRITALHGDLLKPLPEKVDIIVANLPYIASEEIDNLEPQISNFEPRISLDGGIDGTRVIQRLLEQVPDKLNSKGYIMLEIGIDQEQQISSFAKKLFPAAELSYINDLSGITRIVTIAI
jgi:release factor glutamine methyltransferase